MLICLHTIHGYFGAKITEFTNCNIESMAENIYFMGLYRKCLLTPVSYSEVDGEYFDFSFIHSTKTYCLLYSKQY